MENKSRRKFLQNTLTATAAITIGAPLLKTQNLFATEKVADFFQFVQIKLPYSYAALEPSIDALTMEIHYNKHHTAYIKNVNEAIVAEKINFNNEHDFFANVSKLSAKARNNGGGAYNHNFFWESMSPNAGKMPSGKLKKAIEASFGTFDKFKDTFSSAAATRFGSGWAWLIAADGKLKITSTPNQDNPLMDVAADKGIPLLALDVWEHAYYLKYQNRRTDYIANFWNVVNWEKVAERFGE
ncbi:MAG: superoxide dismutase [Sphingobacteriales bacterium]|nr:superoxide dismutase [Sphingobacteriales bacterium]